MKDPLKTLGELFVGFDEEEMIYEQTTSKEKE